jgi:hypothetical protein
MKPITEINIPFDKQQLLAEANLIKQYASGYTDNRYPNLNLSKWLIRKHSSEYISNLIKFLEVDGDPRFYWLEPNAIIPEHVDNGTKCSINFILTDTPAPVTILGENFTYTVGVLDTTKRHGVKNGPVERILFKISIFNEDYESVVTKLLARFNAGITS